MIHAATDAGPLAVLLAVYAAGLTCGAVAGVLVTLAALSLADD